MMTLSQDGENSDATSMKSVAHSSNHSLLIPKSETPLPIQNFALKSELLESAIDLRVADHIISGRSWPPLSQPEVLRREQSYISYGDIADDDQPLNLTTSTARNRRREPSVSGEERKDNRAVCWCNCHVSDVRAWSTDRSHVIVATTPPDTPSSIDGQQQSATTSTVWSTSPSGTSRQAEVMSTEHGNVHTMPVTCYSQHYLMDIKG